MSETKPYVLKAITRGKEESKLYSGKPHKDLMSLPVGGSAESILSLFEDKISGYLVWCEDTAQLWYAPSEECLNTSFVYRDDLVIQQTQSEKDFLEFYDRYAANIDSSIVASTKCYIMNNPGAETYEVYYATNYPTVHYGKATPNGRYITCYKDRFERDAAIVRLEETYSESSSKEAGEYMKRQFDQDEAVIISDGCYVNGVYGYAYYMLDAYTVICKSGAAKTSIPEQGSAIAEISGALNALRECYVHRKMKIKYYYDNVVMSYVFTSEKLKEIPVVKSFKKLFDTMSEGGYSIEFIELHPKTGANRDKDNKALTFFHKQCDHKAREAVDLFINRYRSIALRDEKKGMSGESLSKKRPAGSGDKRRPNARPNTSNRSSNYNH